MGSSPVNLQPEIKLESFLIENDRQECAEDGSQENDKEDPLEGAEDGSQKKDKEDPLEGARDGSQEKVKEDIQEGVEDGNQEKCKEDMQEHAEDNRHEKDQVILELILCTYSRIVVILLSLEYTVLYIYQ